MELASKKKPEIITMDGTDYPLADFTDKGKTKRDCKVPFLLS